MPAPKPGPRFSPRGRDRSGQRPIGPRPAASLWYGLAFLLLLGLAQMYYLAPNGRPLPYSEFKTLLKNGQVAEVTIGEQSIRGTLKQAADNDPKGAKQFTTFLAAYSPEWEKGPGVDKTVNVTVIDPSPLPWAGVTAKSAVWLRRESDAGFIAFSANCTHLGCPVRWMEGAELFMCPCHGGVYYSDGNVAAGPPPRPLFRYDVRVENGEVKMKSVVVPIVTTL